MPNVRYVHEYRYFLNISVYIVVNVSRQSMLVRLRRTEMIEST